MMKATSVIKKVEVTNQNNLKPPRFHGKAGNTYLMWSMKFKADMVMKNLWEAFLSTFERKLPGSKDGPFDLNTEDGKDHQKAVLKNQKAMMQFALSFTNVSLLNKINCKQQKDKANWPTGKAHSLMTVILKEYEPKDTMAEMEMEMALAKMKLGPKKDPNSLNDAMASIKCRYLIEMTNSKKKAPVLRLGGVMYSSVIARTQMILAGERKRASSSHSLERDAHSMVYCGRKGQGQERFRQ